MRELASLFGPEGNLVGITTFADGAIKDSGMACILFNAGVIHRVGPHRLNVKIARALAERGIPTLRFDLSGVGDSPSATVGVSFRQQAVLDLRAAMDYLQQVFGIKRFLLFGICSGGVNAFWTAVADKRVVGIMMFDGFWYRTAWTEPVRRWKRFRALSCSELARGVSLRIKRMLGLAPSSAKAAGIFSATEAYANPPKAEFAAHLQALANREVAVFFLYGGTVMSYFSYAKQFNHAFRGHPFLERVRCDFRPDIDHTVVTLAAQGKLTDLVCDWVASAATTPATNC